MDSFLLPRRESTPLSLGPNQSFVSTDSPSLGSFAPLPLSSLQSSFCLLHSILHSQTYILSTLHAAITIYILMFSAYTHFDSLNPLDPDAPRPPGIPERGAPLKTWSVLTTLVWWLWVAGTFGWAGEVARAWVSATAKGRGGRKLTWLHRTASSRSSSFSPTLTFNSPPLNSPRSRPPLPRSPSLPRLLPSTSTFHPRHIPLNPSLVRPLLSSFSSPTTKPSSIRSTNSSTLGKDSRWSKTSRIRLSTSS